MAKRRPKNRVRRDATDRKKFPNGVSATFSAVLQFWLPMLGGGAGARSDRLKFVAEGKFFEKYLAVVKKYPGIVRPPKGRPGVEKMLHNIVGGKNELPYYQLRALAEYLDLPAGLLVLFTQCVSMEREASSKRSKTKEDERHACLSMLDGMERIIQMTRKRLADSQPGDDVFMRLYDDDGDSYLPNVELLQAWRDAYNRA